MPAIPASEQDSFGERYGRYNQLTEQRMLVARGAVFHDPPSHRRKPQFAACVDRLRDLQAYGKQIAKRAGELRDALAKLD